MKIYFGPYTKWWGPYQIAELLCKFGVSEKKARKLGKWLSNTWVDNLCEWIESKRNRVIKIKIHNYDTWNMDSTLAMIILPMLKQLKDTKQGSPGDMPAFRQTPMSSAQECFDFYELEHDKAWDTGHQEWKDILEKMIWAFEQVVDDTKEPQMLSNGQFDYEEYRDYQNKVQEGLELFGKYYRGLWD